MLQRIQTVYLLLVALLMLTTLFFPLAIVQINSTYYMFDASGISTMVQPKELVFPTWSLMALSAIIVVVALITIFLYKKRILQIRLSIFNAFLIISFYGLFGFYLWKFAESSEIFHFQVRFVLALPFVCLILNYLAIRNIGADEALVRSLDRLRK